MTRVLGALSELFPWAFKRQSTKSVLADPVLEGERVCLRVLTEADAHAMWGFARDPEVTRYLPWEPMATPAAILPFIRDQEARRKRGDAICFAVCDKTTGALIGSTDLVDMRRYLGVAAEIGYLLARDYWGRGIMSEAAGLTARYAFEKLDVKRLIAFADIENMGSRRVLEKIGMHQVDNEWRIVKGERRLYVQYEITRLGSGL